MVTLWTPRRNHPQARADELERTAAVEAAEALTAATVRLLEDVDRPADGVRTTPA